MKTTITDAQGNVTSCEFTEGAQPHSIEVNRNSRGEYSYSVKIYYGENGAVDAVDSLKAIYVELDTHFGKVQP